MILTKEIEDSIVIEFEEIVGVAPNSRLYKFKDILEKEIKLSETAIKEDQEERR